MTALDRHTAYGLTIESELALPEMPPAARVGDPDVVVRIGTVPDHLEGALLAAENYEASADEMLLRISGVARYLVARGNEVIVEPDLDADEHDVRVFLLGTCMGALLHQRGALVLHASGFRTSEGAVLFAGRSGAGKSTLLAEMIDRGFDMMVDDVAGVFPVDHDGLVLQPSYPRTRMWADAAAHLGVETDGLQRTRSHMDKYERQLPDRFWDRPSPIRRIYHLAGSRGDELSLTPVPRVHVVPIIVNNTYRQVFLDGFDIRQRHFELASRVARTVPVVQVIRPADSFRLAELADLILADLG